MQQYQHHQVMVVNERRLFGFPIYRHVIQVVGTDPVTVNHAFNTATGIYDANSQQRLLEYHGEQTTEIMGM